MPADLQERIGFPRLAEDREEVVEIPPLTQLPSPDAPFDLTQEGDSSESNHAPIRPVSDTDGGAMLEVHPGVPTLGHSEDTLVVLATWRQWLEAQYAPATVRLYWLCAMRFFGRHPIPVQSVTEEHIVDFLQQFPFRSSSRRSYYQGMKSLCTWAVRRGLIERDPMENVRAPVVHEKEPRALSEDECLRVLEAAYARHRYRGAALRLLYYTGARVGEVVTIQWTDVNEDRLVLHGHKTGKDRIIEMTPGLKDSLAELWECFGTYQFVLPRTKQTVWEWCRQAGKDAGIEKVHPHLFRSTAATTMLKRGARIHAVRSILGHKDVGTTMRYVAIDGQDRKEALDLL